MQTCKIEKSTIHKLQTIRNEYFNSLPEFQELFLELMVNDSDCYLLTFNNSEIGYAIVNADKVLIEFYVTKKYLLYSHQLFKKVVSDLSVAEVYCKSFDALLLSNCLLCSFPYIVIGILYRDYIEPLVPLDSDIEIKRATLDSCELFRKQDESIKELFETEEQLTTFISNERVFEFYKRKEFIGCGMVLRTHTEWDFCDLGVWVSPLHRGRAFGTQILLNLRAIALENHLKPSCGCAIENVASQKTIEKSGFVSRYKMINFQIV